MVEMAVKNGKSTNPNLKVGICGEHGGEPSSVEFFHLAGLDYVSCSPFRVPIARVAAAIANLTHQWVVVSYTKYTNTVLFYFLYINHYFIVRPASGMKTSKILFNSPSSCLLNSPVLHYILELRSYSFQ